MPITSANTSASLFRSARPAGIVPAPLSILGWISAAEKRAPLPGTSEQVAEPTGRYDKRGLCCRIATACPLLPLGTEAGHLHVSAAPVSDSAARRTIGDILLAHGFVAEEALAEATAEQERTAQPLGQILVQNGVITRLELASALAEQWSDPSASITLLPHSTPGPPLTPQPHDDAQYAARLQDAVADLARRVQANQPLEGLDERVADLSQRIEATLGRTQLIEATVATLAESLEGVTGGVEEAFVALQTGTAGLALELARIDRTVAALAARPVESPPPDPVLSQRLEELRAAVDALAGRPVADDAARGRVEELASRLETLVDGAALDDLRGALRELEARPPGDPELEARLDRVEALVTEGAAGAELEAQTAMLVDLRATLTDLEARPVSSPDIDARLERIETHLAESLASAADTAAVDALAVRVETAADAQEGLMVSIEALGARIDEIAGRDGRDNGVATRLDGIEAHLEAETAAVAALRDAVAAQAEPSVEGRLEELTLALDSVRSELSTIALPPAPDPALADQVDTLAARVEQLAADRTDHDSLVAKLEAVEIRLASDLDTIDVLARAIDRIRHDLTSAPTAPPSDPPAIEDELERVRIAIERVGLHLGEHDRTLAELMRSRGVTQRLDELSARIDEIVAAETGGGAAAGSGTPAGDVSGDMRALMRRVEESETSSQADREKLMSHLERMASSIDWRLQRLETDDPDAS